MRLPVTSVVLDICCVIAFVAIGRATHHHPDALAGIVRTAWPFLAGLAVGLLAAGFWRRPAALAPTGLGALAGAAGVGMAIRVMAGQGTATAFEIVTFAFLGLFLLGWRLLALLASRLTTRRRLERA